MPAYDPIRPERKTKVALRISHTIPVAGHGSVEQEAEARIAWRRGQ